MRLLEAIKRVLIDRCLGCSHTEAVAGCVCPDGRCWCANCGTSGAYCTC